jgi:hypothetical protein
MKTTTTFNVRYILIAEYNTIAAVRKEKDIYCSIRPGGKMTFMNKLSAKAGTLIVALIAAKGAPSDKQQESLFCLLATLSEAHPKAKVMGMHPTAITLPDARPAIGIFKSNVFLQMLKKAINKKWT